MQRNRLASALAAVFAVSLIAGVIADSGQAREAQEQRDAAQAQARQARNTVEFLKEVSFAGNPFSTGEDQQSISDVLRAAEQGVRSAYADDPASRALILTALGEILISRGEYQRGAHWPPRRSTCTPACPASMEMKRPMPTGSRPSQPTIRTTMRKPRSSWELAVALFTEQQSPDWSGLVKAYDQLGMAQSNRHGEDTALVAYNKALEIYRARELDDPGQLVTILNNIATENLQRGNGSGRGAAQ